MGRLKWGVLLGLIVVFVVVTAWPSRTGKGDVTLTFVGFTNESFQFQSGPGYGTSMIPMAVLKAENLGSRPVEVWNVVRLGNLQTTTNAVQFRTPYATTKQRFPRILKPGESFLLRIHPPELGKDFCWTELKYYRKTTWNAFYSWAWGKSSTGMKSLMGWVLPTPEEVWVQSESIARPNLEQNSLPTSNRTNESPVFRSVFDESLFEDMKDLDQRVRERLLEPKKAPDPNVRERSK